MAIVLHQVCAGYGRRPAVADLSGRFAPGQLTAVVGANGAGKSTLLKSIVGLVPLSSGRIQLDGLSAADIAYLPQQSALDRSFPLTVGDVVALGDWRRSGWLRGVMPAARRRVDDALESVGLGGFARRGMDELSAGQFQRVLFARMRLQDAPVVLLDEPFTALDAASCDVLMATIRAWQAEGRTVIAVLHDLAQVRRDFPNTLLLARHAVAWGPTAEALSPAHLEQAAGLALSQASLDEVAA